MSAAVQTTDWWAKVVADDEARRAAEAARPVPTAERERQVRIATRLRDDAAALRDAAQLRLDEADSRLRAAEALLQEAVAR